MSDSEDRSSKVNFFYIYTLLLKDKTHAIIFHNFMLVNSQKN